MRSPALIAEGKYRDAPKRRMQLQVSGASIRAVISTAFVFLCFHVNEKMQSVNHYRILRIKRQPPDNQFQERPGRSIRRIRYLKIEFLSTC